MFLRRLILPVTATWLALGCGKDDDNCPGLCPDETAIPTMTISTADGAASIASAKVASGPCTAMVLRSEGEAGVPTTYAQVRVTYHWPTDVPPLCILEITSRYGQVESVAVQVKSKPYTQNCCPYGSCCPKSQDAPTQRYHMEFQPQTATVSFPPPPDGGMNDDAADAQDAPANDDVMGIDSRDLDGSALDLSPLDSSVSDTGDLDAVTVDVADEMDLATDT